MLGVITRDLGIEGEGPRELQIEGVRRPVGGGEYTSELVLRVRLFGLKYAYDFLLGTNYNDFYRACLI